MVVSGPEPLTVAHDVSQFACGKPSLDRWLRTHALSNQQKGFTAVLVVHEANRIIGYYGLAPTAPLADATNLCRTASQTLLTGWLTYLTGKGQADLPDGFRPLTSELKAQAATTITQVGATPAATPCTTAGATPTTTGLPSDPTPTGPDDGSTFSDTSPNASFTPSSSNSSVSSDGSSAAPAPADSTELAAQATVPDYGGSSVASGVAAMAAIFGIIVLTALAAKATAGRRSGVSGP